MTGRVMVIISGWFFVSWLFVGEILASGEFGVRSRVVYEIEESGNARVRQEVSLKNLVTEKYLEEFGLGIEGKGVSGFEVLGSEGEQLEVAEGGEGEWRIIMPKLLGKGKTQELVISYVLEGVVESKGDVWNVSLPRMDTQAYDELEVEVGIPMGLGRLAMVDPEPVEVERWEEVTILRYGKEDVGRSGIVAVFGEMQVYDVSLSYFLRNDEEGVRVEEIAIPADSDWQRVVYEEIEPEPENVRVDEDGNWLAEYRLGSGKEVRVQVQVQVQVYSTAQPLSLEKPEDFSEWLKVDDYWEVDATTLQGEAGRYQTPREIYDWVIETLDYDFNRVGSWEERFGALAALGHPEHAICSDYTDLFVVKARAAGIPARQVVGYAHSMHPSLRPVSLVKDVLHTWPEYWDDDRGLWVGVDQTWGETTGGMDYFNFQSIGIGSREVGELGGGF
jgi:transglutaminase-like putative cysteine protease